MNCMRCGRECEGQDVFCVECLSYMAKNPVKPGTTINLPNRHNRPRQLRKRESTPEELIKQLKKRLDARGIWIAVLTILLVATAGVLVLDLTQPIAVRQFMEDVLRLLP